MNKSLKILITMTLALLLTGNAFADSVSITVNGRILPSPCTTINDGNPGVLVPFGDLQINSFSIPGGNGSDWINFTIPVSGCPAGTNNVVVTFSGTMDPTDSMRWKNTAGGTAATNISIDLLNPPSTRITNGTSITVPITAGTAIIPLRTHLFSALGSPMPGAVATVIVATFTYQ
ncbi:hypothetical protein FH968_22525 [Buttiauxella sp. B2]|uniref:fimbrial protein n=1 Tax=Buttiauxella sp. B2 TaxID=2587812 RepID=UPI00111D644E|nr:fimbrial protein [Buttiauxella sp. B2]TNV11212.1 hypothetical protein FH968_22525 [Buttiauxella sp. B2]